MSARPPWISRSGIAAVATGARFGTSTRKLCDAPSPSKSVAVTVTFAEPGRCAVRVSEPSASASATTSVSELSALHARGSPSGSLKCAASATVADSPEWRLRRGIVPATTGGRLGTTTSKLCEARSSPGSVAVTVTTALPRARAATASVLPETDARATRASETTAEYASTSPSGSAKKGATSTVAVRPTSIRRSRRVLVTVGDRLATATAKSCAALSPSVSVAVTLTFTLPGASARRVRRPSDRSSATRNGLELVALQARGSPSGSLKKFARATTPDSPTARLRPLIVAVATGGRLGTVIVKACATLSPAESLAVTVALALPLARADTTSVLPATAARATPASETVAENSRSSPSGSAKWVARSTVSARPTSISRSGGGSRATGAWFGTSIVELCETLSPAGSLAVTVTVALPLARAATTSAPPDTDALATLVSETVAACSSASPSGSAKKAARSTVSARPTSISRSGSVSLTTGERLRTTTAKSCAGRQPAGIGGRRGHAGLAR